MAVDALEGPAIAEEEDTGFNIASLTSLDRILQIFAQYCASIGRYQNGPRHISRRLYRMIFKNIEARAACRIGSVLDHIANEFRPPFAALDMSEILVRPSVQAKPRFWPILTPP